MHGYLYTHGNNWLEWFGHGGGCLHFKHQGKDGCKICLVCLAEYYR